MFSGETGLAFTTTSTLLFVLQSSTLPSGCEFEQLLVCCHSTVHAAVMFSQPSVRSFIILAPGGV